MEVNHSREIDEIFDAISYRKGASVIRMLHNYLGAECFQVCNGSLPYFFHGQESFAFPRHAVLFFFLVIYTVFSTFFWNLEKAMNFMLLRYYAIIN